MSNVTHINKARGHIQPQGIIETLVRDAPGMKAIVVAYSEIDEDGVEVIRTMWSTQKSADILFAAEIIRRQVMDRTGC
ncbi:MAG: hypothetical protein ACRC2H_00980 [Silanimonas sp.]